MPENQVTKKSMCEVIKRIESLEDSVRNHINTNRYQADLLKDLNNWNQICSSLDTIGDTLYSIQDYLGADYPESVGFKYIFTYGLLQALFIQQDAMRHLSEAFDIKFELTEKLDKIRRLRNASIGHPTKHNVKKSTFYNYISRITLSKIGFTLMRYSEQDRTEFIDINIYSILNDQLHEIEDSYKLLSFKLSEVDRMHKEKFKKKLLVDLFHSSMGYIFSKVAEGIHSPNTGNSFGLSMLRSIQKTYREFEAALNERNELSEYTKFNLDEYNHALSKLENYLTGNNSELKEIDARIYLFYVREQHNHFVQIAGEIDENYKEKV